MDPFKHLKSIQEMLDRADPGRKFREQQEALGKSLEAANFGRKLLEQQDAMKKAIEAANPGPKLLEQHDSIRKAMEAANPGRKLLEQHEATRNAFDASSLMAQYDQRLSPPSEVFESSARTAELSREMLGSMSTISNDPTRQFEASLFNLSRRFAHQETQLHSALSSSLGALRDIHVDPKFLERTNSIATAAKDFSVAYESLVVKGFHGLANVMSEQAEWLGRIQSASSPVLGMLAHELAGGLTSGLSPAMVEGFGSELSTRIWQVSQSDSPEEAQVILEAVTAWLLALLSRLPNTRLSREAALAIFLTLASMLVGHIFSLQTEKRIVSRVEASRSAIEERLRKLEATVDQLESEPAADNDSEDSRFCMVVTDLRLRSGPGTDFDVLRVLPSNLSVRVVESSDGWAFVEFFDFVEGRVISGWVSDEYLLDWTE